jgi:uncharacterized membrane protein
MEFFQLDDESKELKVSPQIWIFFVTAAAVTALTMILYYAKTKVTELSNVSTPLDIPAVNCVPSGLRRGGTDLEKNARRANS